MEAVAEAWGLSRTRREIDEVVDATGEAAPVARRAGVGLAARRVLGRAMHHLSAAWRGPRAVLRDG